MALLLPLLLCLLRISNAPPRGDELFTQSDRLFNRIYAGSVRRVEAESLLARLHERLLPAGKSGADRSHRGYRFPLGGYGFRQFDDGKGRGFVGENSYDFFDGNGHKGHPALDLFVFDRNQDCIDDRTGKPIPALAVTDGMVLSTYNGWDSTKLDTRGRMLRGGNQVWLYSPADNEIWYYAHLKDVTVKAGDEVRGGDPVGTVGRTGANAMRRRSPTHLHVMLLVWKNSVLAPRNPYGILKDSR